MTDELPSGRVPLTVPAILEGVKDLWGDYHWPSKGVVALLLSSCIVGAALAGWPSVEVGSNPALKVFASDAFRTLLTLSIGLFVTINFYMRARRRILQGDEHHSIARALAFGYFRNSLVPALQIAVREGAQLQVFRPQSMEDVQVFTSRLEPQIREHFEEVWLPLVEPPIPDRQSRRTALALRRPLTRPSEVEPSQAFFFDIPSDLFTALDFCSALNRPRVEQHRQPIDESLLIAYQEGQVDSFFGQLDVLFTTHVGSRTVGELGPTLAAISSLRMSLRYVGLDELESRYPAPTTHQS
jgi:hypothetical protein